ncbi:hypothetical protein ACFLW8_05020 [Chloroflexota bacterium]
MAEADMVEAVALLAVAIVHIILHWKWIVRMSKQFMNQAVQQLRGAYPKPLMSTNNLLVSGTAIPVDTDSTPGARIGKI